MVSSLRTLSTSPKFTQTITAAILVAGIAVGLETSPAVTDRIGGLLHILDTIILWIFVAEAAIKIGAEGARPWRYFTDPWNVFDFAIVAVCFMPVDAEFVAVLRLARLMRVLKLVRAVPKLQLLVSALLKAIPSMGYVAMLLGLLFYIFAVAAVFLFGANDPVRFANLPLAVLSLFTVVTGEGWTEVMYIQMYGCANYGYGDYPQLCTQSVAQPLLGAGFFVSFMLLGAMIILNLFIGVIMGGMEEAREENEQLERDRKRELGLEPNIADKLGLLLEQMGTMQHEILQLRRRAEVVLTERDEARQAAGLPASPSLIAPAVLLSPSPEADPAQSAG